MAVWDGTMLQVWWDGQFLDVMHKKKGAREEVSCRDYQRLKKKSRLTASSSKTLNIRDLWEILSYNWKCNFPMTPHVRPFVGWLVCMSVCHNFLKGREVTLPCSGHVFPLEFAIITFSRRFLTESNLRADLGLGGGRRGAPSLPSSSSSSSSTSATWNISRLYSKSWLKENNLSPNYPQTYKVS